MNNVFVYIELENGVPADVSLELLTKGREAGHALGVKLEAVVLGHNLGDIAKELAKYGADTVWDGRRQGVRSVPHVAPYGCDVRSDRAGEAPVALSVRPPSAAISPRAYRRRCSAV